LKLYEGAITTNEAFDRELKKYFPEIFINRNVTSEEMWKLSEKILEKKSKIKFFDEIIIGYFSGSIFHNPDIQKISPFLIKIF